MGRGFSDTKTGGLGRFSYKTLVAWKRILVEQGEAHCILGYPLQNQEYVKVLLLRWEHAPRCYYRTTGKRKDTDVGVVCAPDICKITRFPFRGPIRCSFATSGSSSVSTSAPFVRPRLACLCRRQADRKPQPSGSPRVSAEEVLGCSIACGAAPRATFVFVEYAKHDGESHKSEARFEHQDIHPKHEMGAGWNSLVLMMMERSVSSAGK